MQINQFNFSYLPIEDRLLFRLTTESDLYMLFFTRRLVKALSSSLDELFEKQTNIQLASKSAMISDEASSAYTQFEHDSAIQGKNFNAEFDVDKKQFPWGNSPVLVNDIKISLLSEKEVRISFNCINKQTISVTFNEKLIHGFYHAIAKLANSADWELQFKLQEVKQSLQ